jgi:hypothetical protein
MTGAGCVCGAQIRLMGGIKEKNGVLQKFFFPLS